MAPYPNLQPPQGHIQQRRGHKRELKPDIARRLSNRPRVPNLRHARNDQRKANDTRPYRRQPTRQLPPHVPDRVIIRREVHPPKHEQLNDKHRIEESSIIPDQCQEILQARLPLLGRLDRKRDHDGRHGDREDEARHPGEERDQHLQVERDRVHADGDVADDAEGEEHDDEPAEAAGGREHLVEDAADAGDGVGGLPGGDLGDGAADRGAEDEEGDGGEEEA